MAKIRPNRIEPAERDWRRRLYEIIFEAETPAGKTFDVILLWAIGLSVAAVMLESVEPVRVKYGLWLNIAEWVFTVVFTVEYVLRILSCRHPSRYIFSFFGIIDLLACIPTYLSLFFTGSEYLLVIRILRMLRVFRILKMARHLREGAMIMNALVASRQKITVFLFGILSLTVIMGTLMYLIEGGEHGFTSIPQAVYWAIVTITTVGYGDITPTTVPGKCLSAAMMIMGYAIIAVPTGVVTVELFREFRQELQPSTRTCGECTAEGHRVDARHCYRCGSSLPERSESSGLDEAGKI